MCLVSKVVPLTEVLECLAGIIWMLVGIEVDDLRLLHCALTLEQLLRSEPTYITANQLTERRMTHLEQLLGLNQPILPPIH